MSVDLPHVFEASPFIEGTQIQFAWDSVSLTSILSCPYRYKLEIIEGWQPRNPNFAIALVFGILYHEGMQYYHEAKAEGQDHEEAIFTSCRKLTQQDTFWSLPTFEEIEEIKEETDDEDDGITLRNSKIRTRYHLLRAVVWYLDNYANDPLETFILPSGAAAVEQSFRVDLPFESGGHPLLLSGHLDRVVTFNDHLYVTDYKTTKSLSRQFFSAFKLSHQFSGYIFGGNISFDRPISGAYIDGIALLVGGAKFSRAPTQRSPGELDEYFRTVKYAADLARTCHETQNYPRNTSACYFCQYKTICEQPPEYRQKYLEMWFQQQPAWNPLRNR